MRLIVLIPIITLLMSIKPVFACSYNCIALQKQQREQAVKNVNQRKSNRVLIAETPKVKNNHQRVKLWVDGILPIKLHQKFDNHRDRIRIYNACNWWAKNARIKCVKWKEAEHRDYVFVIPAHVNRSYIGRAGGKQYMELSSLKVKGVIVHEFGHALGFAHQHNAPMRDQYIEIITENIQEQSKLEFIKLKGAITHTAYDFCSIMHYKLTGFSKNGKMTIKIKGKKPKCKVGQREYLSKLDIVNVQAKYGVNI